MPRPRTRDGELRVHVSSLVLFIALAAVVVALVFLFGTHMFNSVEQGMDVTKTQPSIETPATGDNKKP